MSQSKYINSNYINTNQLIYLDIEFFAEILACAAAVNKIYAVSTKK